MDCAPIVFFAYDRPDHARRTLTALADNEWADQSAVTIFCDGPRDESRREAVEKTRQTVQSVAGFASKTIVTRETNYGLAKSLIRGISDTLEQSDRVIVVEDDVMTSRYFLRFMNEALATFESNTGVGSVHGFKYPTGVTPTENFFLKYFDSWGWATWRDRWRMFETDGARLLREIDSRGLGRSFDFNGNYPFRQMLQDQVLGRNDSWAIRWQASLYLGGLLSYYPRYSLVNSIGLDGSGTHGAGEFYATEIHQQPIPVAEAAVVENMDMRAATEAYFRRSLPSLAGRLMNRVRRLVGGTR